MKKNRIFAAVCGLLLVATLLLSSDYIIEKAHHNCVGEDCPICRQIEAALKTISGIKALPALFVTAVFCFLILFYHFFSKESAYVRSTLVSLKVELLN